ncbi:hypothetical protein [Heyndrickxia sporothermodurans]|uniref:hypothetical protein n=1 Tax=Heyndrickxia sporothermodurans TaxID=46224 RepID=UPI0035DBE5C6
MSETKVVKIRGDLHKILKVYSAKKGDVTITDLINLAAEEYIEKNAIKEYIK